MWRRGLSHTAKMRSRCGVFRGAPVLSSHGCLGGTPHVGQAIANIWLAWISQPIMTQFMNVKYRNTAVMNDALFYTTQAEISDVAGLDGSIVRGFGK